MKANPYTQKCESLYERKEHVCFGVSPFNSYFSEQKLKELAQWGLKHFQKIHFFVPDAPSSYTLEALGYSPEDAQKKARKQGQYTINKIYKVLEGLGLSCNEASDCLLNWSVLSENPQYLKISKQVHSIFESDLVARKLCLEASRWVLEKRVPDPMQLTEEQLLHAVQYFLCEIPIFTHTAEVVGVESSVFCYHQCIEFLDLLYRDRLPFQVSPKQGFVLIANQQSGFAIDTLQSGQASLQQPVL